MCNTCLHILQLSCEFRSNWISLFFTVYQCLQWHYWYYKIFSRYFNINIVSGICVWIVLWAKNFRTNHKSPFILSQDNYLTFQHQQRQSSALGSQSLAFLALLQHLEVQQLQHQLFPGWRISHASSSKIPWQDLYIIPIYT